MDPERTDWVRAHRETLEEEIRFLEAQQAWLEELATSDSAPKASEWRARLQDKLASDRERLAAVRAAWERAKAAERTAAGRDGEQGRINRSPADRPESGSRRGNPQFFEADKTDTWPRFPGFSDAPNRGREPTENRGVTVGTPGRAPAEDRGETAAPEKALPGNGTQRHT